MGTGFAKKKKEAKMLQQQMMAMQEQIKKAEAIGTAGNGLVTITLTGELDLRSIVIKPECVDPEDVDGLQDLIKAAYTDAKKKLDSQTKMPAMGGAMPNIGSMFGL
jgi:DNA-binding YbaB/EbfC family protein